MIKITGRRRKLTPTRATLADVARAAAVSTASASRALTRPELVSERLRLGVIEAAQALAYVPNTAARALVRNRSGLIGVAAGDLEKSGVAQALHALDEGLSDRGMALLVSLCADPRAPQASVRALLSRGIEALVFIGVDLPRDLSEIPGILALPRISVDRTDDAGFVANAGLDLLRSDSLVADYLLQLGHRRLALVTDAISVIGESPGLRRADRAGQGMTLEHLKLDEEPVAEGLRRWLALPQPPTAAICRSDPAAVALMQACARRGVDVPGQLSIVGFGDTALARCVSPMLTSVRIPGRGAGMATAEYLIAHFTGSHRRHAEWPIKLVVRGSTRFRESTAPAGT